MVEYDHIFPPHTPRLDPTRILPRFTRNLQNRADTGGLTYKQVAAKWDSDSDSDESDDEEEAEGSEGEVEVSANEVFDKLVTSEQEQL